jgi:Protein of unknown function (DUF2786)
MNTSTSATERAAQLSRIRGLMAKTIDNGCTEAEAAGAAAAVDRLLALYEIDLDEVTLKSQEIVALSVANCDHPVKSAAQQISRFTDCVAWSDDRGATLVYFGFKVDTEISEYLTILFRRAIDSELATVTLFNPQYDARPASSKSDFKDSFGIGMATRLGERLAELKSKRDFTQRSSGTDLVAIKLPLVRQAFSETGATLRSARKVRPIRDRAAFASGHSAGNNVAINAGIATRASAGGRLR